MKLKTSKEIILGDAITINDSSCKISELMKNNQNIKIAKEGEIVTIGRIKGRIRPGDKIYKTVSSKLIDDINKNLRNENIKRIIDIKIIAKINVNLKLEVEDKLTGITVDVSGEKVQQAQKTEIKEERIKDQLIKTGGTVFEVDKINMILDNNIFLSIKEINSLRRNALIKIEKEIIKTFKRNWNEKNFKFNEKHGKSTQKNIKLSILLNKIKPEYNYEDIKNINNVYLHLSQIIDTKNEKAIKQIINNFNTYIYIPAIVKEQYMELVNNKIEKLIKSGIKGFVISNLSQLEWLEKHNLPMIANYTMNTFNDQTILELKKLGLSKITISPELNREEIENLSSEVDKELIIYGRTLLMTSEYCPIGTFKGCQGKCEQGKYILKDRMGFEFPVLTDRVNCNSYIYNSKITSIRWKDLNINSIRLDFLDETIEEINNIVEIHKKGERIEGQDYTNGNMNKEV